MTSHEGSEHDYTEINIRCFVLRIATLGYDPTYKKKVTQYVSEDPEFGVNGSY